MAHENPGLCCRETQDGLIIETIHSGCLSRLKIDARFAAQAGASTMILFSSLSA